MTPLPPARYRIEERGRRLVVIDQWAGNVEVTASMPARADVVRPSPSASVAANRVGPGSLSASADSQRLAAGSSVRNTAASASNEPRREAPRGGTGGGGTGRSGTGRSGSGGGANALARMTLRLTPAAGGAYQLSTTRLYDLKGPRQVWLGPRQVQSINGIMVLVAVGLAVVGVIGLLTSPALWVVPAFLLFNTIKSIRTKLTEKIDRLDPR